MKNETSEYQIDIYIESMDYGSKTNKVDCYFTTSGIPSLSNQVLVLNDGQEQYGELNKDYNKAIYTYPFKKKNSEDIIVIYFDICFAVCWERNAQRDGRAFVSKSVVRRMINQFVTPTFNEKYKYKEIWCVDAQGNIVKEIDDHE